MTERAPEEVAPLTLAEVETRSRDGNLETSAGHDRGPPSPGSGAVPLTGLFGRYRILGQLGRGGMGTVYLALDQQLDRQVALKVPQFDTRTGQQGLERFFREARLMAALRHPNLCPVYDVDEIRGTYYLTMAFIDGQPLSALIHPLWPQRNVAALLQKLARAVHVAHQAGVIHRDLKPANIMIQRGEPIVMDFGLARRDFSEETMLTQAGMIVGTPAYMSPEQVAGQKTGPATDIYSLGVILYQMLSGSLPFQGSLVTVLGQIVTQEPRPLREIRADVDPGLEQICLRSLAKKPEDRYVDAGELAEAFAASLRTFERASSADYSTQHFVPPPPVMTPPSQLGASATNAAALTEAGGTSLTAATATVVSRFRRPLLATAIVAVAVVLAVGAWHFWSASPPIPELRSAAVTPLRPAPDEVVSATPATETPKDSADAEPAIAPAPSPPPPPTLRETALADLAAGRFASALARFDELLTQADARDEDFGHRARARLGLAEAGDDPVANFGLAAADFERASCFRSKRRATPLWREQWPGRPTRWPKNAPPTTSPLPPWMNRCWRSIARQSPWPSSTNWRRPRTGPRNWPNSKPARASANARPWPRRVSRSRRTSRPLRRCSRRRSRWPADVARTIRKWPSWISRPSPNCRRHWS